MKIDIKNKVLCNPNKQNLSLSLSLKILPSFIFIYFFLY